MSSIIRGVFDPQIILMYLQTTKTESDVQVCKFTRVKTYGRKIGPYIPTRYIHIWNTCHKGVIKKIESQSQIRRKMYHMGGRLHIGLNWHGFGYYCQHIDQWLANKTSKALPNKHSSSWLIILSSCASMISLPFLRTNDVLDENPPVFMLTRCKIWWQA